MSNLAFDLIITPAALVLDGKKLAAFSAAAGRFLRFLIGDAVDAATISRLAAASPFEQGAVGGLQ
jgi:hypothetical protein